MASSSKRKLKILLCHDRFIFRFGVDRVLLVLAQEFRSRGHAVTLLGYEFDDASRSAADRVLQIPEADAYHERDVHALRWIEATTAAAFDGNDRPDIVVSAGWPFLSCIPYFEGRGSRVFYQDHGLIPTDGMPEFGRRAMRLLGDLKMTFVPHATGVIAISRFILESQSRGATRPGQNVLRILHGVDHVDRELWSQPAASRVDVDFQSCPRPRILVLGRFEPGTYKNSQLAFALELRIREWAPSAWIGMLATEAEVQAAAEGPTAIVALGHFSDAQLYAAIRASDVCVSLSTWEGFNLPLAEAQALGRPCLVFDRGAHPEVVANPWLLCADLDAMAAKIRQIVEGRAPRSLSNGRDFRSFAAQRKWKRAADEYFDVFASALESSHGRLPVELADDAASSLADEKQWMVVDLTSACTDRSNSGCIRVARRLGAELQRLVNVAFVVWERERSCFRFPSSSEWEVIGLFGGPTPADGLPVSIDRQPELLSAWLERTGVRPRWLALPEIRHPEDLRPILREASTLDLCSAAVFHDAIPVLRPDLVTDARYRDTHFDYMCALAECDVVLANSHFSEQCLLEFWRDQRLEGSVLTCVLPGGDSGPRPHPIPEAERQFEGRKFILCVSTIEPRKNHRRLVEAFFRLKAEQPSFDYDLILVGNRYAGSPELGEWLDELTLEQRGVRWLGVVSDEQLTELYRNCEFTIYPSELEGFGLPIMESIWCGRPCLCHNQGVMAELADGGGCLTADLTQVDAFQAAMANLANDHELRQSLERECQRRTIKRWADYASEVVASLAARYWSTIANV